MEAAISRKMISKIHLGIAVGIISALIGAVAWLVIHNYNQDQKYWVAPPPDAYYPSKE